MDREPGRSRMGHTSHLLGQSLCPPAAPEPSDHSGRWKRKFGLLPGWWSRRACSPRLNCSLSKREKLSLILGSLDFRYFDFTREQVLAYGRQFLGLQIQEKCALDQRDECLRQREEESVGHR